MDGIRILRVRVLAEILGVGFVMKDIDGWLASQIAFAVTHAPIAQEDTQ
jgi:hypothetical protein